MRLAALVTACAVRRTLHFARSPTPLGLTRAGIAGAAVSKGVHKCLELLDQHRIGGDRKRSLSKGDKLGAKGKRAKSETVVVVSASETRKQKSLDAFLPPPKRAPQPKPEAEEEAIVISD